MITARGWGLPFWSCQQNSSSKQAGGFYFISSPYAVGIEKSGSRVWKFCLFSPFPKQGIKWKIMHNLLSLLSNTNFLKCTICPVFQHQYNLKTGYSPIFISPTVAAVKWITLLHALKQDSNLFSTTKLVAMVIKLWNPWHNNQTAMLWWYNDQNRNRKEHLKYKDTLKKLNFLHSLI